MFAETPLDPTAGERARDVREFPERPHPITGRTDPRYGIAEVEPGRARAGRARADEPVVQRDDGPF